MEPSDERHWENNKNNGGSEGPFRTAVIVQVAQWQRQYGDEQGLDGQNDRGGEGRAALEEPDDQTQEDRVVEGDEDASATDDPDTHDASGEANDVQHQCDAKGDVQDAVVTQVVRDESSKDSGDGRQTVVEGVEQGGIVVEVQVEVVHKVVAWPGQRCAIHHHQQTAGHGVQVDHGVLEVLGDLQEVLLHAVGLLHRFHLLLLLCLNQCHLIV